MHAIVINSMIARLLNRINIKIRFLYLISDSDIVFFNILNIDYERFKVFIKLKIN